MHRVDELLEKVKAKGAEWGGVLHALIRHGPDSQQGIAQLKRLWDALPDSAKADKDLESSLISDNEGTSAGAYAEIVANFVLRKYAEHLIYKPKIGKLSPDYHVTTKTHRFIAEVFSLGLDEAERKRSSIWKALKRELEAIQSSKFITILGNPIPNSSGNFHGLGQIVAKMMAALEIDNDSSKKFEAEANGARIRFSLVPRSSPGSILGGWVPDAYWGDSHVPMLRNRLNEKTKKYRFPFVGVCVATSWADDDTFRTAMIGQTAVEIPIYEGERVARQEEIQVTNKFDGYWGINSPEFEKHHLLQCLLIVKLHWSTTGEVEITCRMMRNPYFDSNWRQVFHEIPDLGDQGEDKPSRFLRITP